MSESLNEMSFVCRCKAFFGPLPGQELREFAKELRLLSDQDKQELVELFNQADLPTKMPKDPPSAL